MPGLMAIGEAACVSVHGANRLGPNSLLDLIVFGRAVAERAAESSSPRAPEPLSASAEEPASPASTISATRGVGSRPARSASRCSRRCRSIAPCSVPLRCWRKAWATSAMSVIRSGFGVADRSMIWNTDLVDALELDNMIGQAQVTLCSARYRTESRGAHARETIPTATTGVGWCTPSLGATATAGYASGPAPCISIHCRTKCRRSRRPSGCIDDPNRSWC